MMGKLIIGTVIGIAVGLIAYYFEWPLYIAAIVGFLCSLLATK